MCENAPGPRCSYDMNKRVNVRRKAYQNALSKFGEDSVEAKLAAARFSVAIKDYETTPEGLSGLDSRIKEAVSETEKIQLIQKKNVAERTRLCQINAINEIKNGRVEALINIYSQANRLFDKEEVESVIESTREFTEEKYLQKISEITNSISSSRIESVTEEEYDNFLLNITDKIDNPVISRSLTTLKNLPLPDKVSFASYKNVPLMFERSKKSLQTQLRSVAILQNTSPAIIAAYYDEYRKQYKNMYSHLPSAEQPNPPESWVKGEFNYSGYSRNPHSKFAPHDKASMYAISRLTADDNSIPDYMKQSRQFVLVEQSESEIKLTSYNDSGRELKHSSYPKTVNSSKTSVKNELEGKIVFSDAPPSDSGNKFNSKDFISKIFDLPSYSSSFVSTVTKQKVDGDANNFFVARKKAKQIWKAKAARANAPVVEPNSLTNRWI